MIVSFPERFTYVRILTTRDLREKVIATLQELGIMEVEPIGKIPEEDVKALKEKAREVEELERLIESLESTYEKPVIVEITQDIDVSTLDEQLSKTLEILRRLKGEVGNLIYSIDNMGREFSKLRTIHSSLEALLPVVGDVPIKNIVWEGDLIYSMVVLGSRFSINNVAKEIPEDTLIVARAPIEDKDVAVIAGMKISKDSLSELLKKNKVEILPIEPSDKTLSEELGRLEAKINELAYESKKLQDKLKEILESNAPEIGYGKVVSEIYRSKLNALMSALGGDYLAGVEGWVPEPEFHLVPGSLQKEVGTFYISRVEKVDREPPTKLKNRKPIKPFELITRLYGVPDRREWDPTPIIMYSFMIFFGAMFADFVYGIILFILIKFVLDRSGLIDNPYSEGYVTLKKMLLMLAISSTVFGLLSNTFAGFSFVLTENGWVFTLPEQGAAVPSILNFVDPIWFLTFALVVGLIHINISHGISLAKGIKEGNFGHVMMEAGIFIVQIFGIPYILHSMMHYDIFPMSDQMLTVFLGASLVGLGMLIAGSLKSMGGLGMLMWFFSITGLLGDILSYSRLAGLGLATYLMAKSFNGLSLEVFTTFSSMIPLAGIVIGAVAAAFIMLAMNMINIVFGVIGAFVHSLRLCFVEFLPKWYEGNGREFQPLTAKLGKHILVGKGV